VPATRPIRRCCPSPGPVDVGLRLHARSRCRGRLRAARSHVRRLRVVRNCCRVQRLRQSPVRLSRVAQSPELLRLHRAAQSRGLLRLLKDAGLTLGETQALPPKPLFS
jgi:hypothetical protein